jgi:hypothetical protein
MKRRIELSTSKCPFKTVEGVRKLKGIYSSNVIDESKVVVWYDSRKVKEKQIARIATYSKCLANRSK